MSTDGGKKNPNDDALGIGEGEVDDWGDLFDGLHEQDKHGSVDALLAGQEPVPEAPGDVMADLLGDDGLEFIGEAQALGGMLGQSEPMPLAEPESEAAKQAVPSPLPTPRPTPFVETVPRGAPVLADAPSDDELFGNLPDDIPDAASADAPPGAGGDTTGVAERTAMPVADSGRMGAAIVRREDLKNQRAVKERQSAATALDAPSDFRGGEVTRMASAQVLQGMADAAAAEFDEPATTAQSLVLDEDFYGDIVISGADDGTSAAGPEPAAEPAPRTSPRRTNVHTVRRAATKPEPATAGGVVEMDVDDDGDELAPEPRAPAEVVSGRIDRDADDDDAVITSGASFDSAPSSEVETRDERDDAAGARDDLETLGLGEPFDGEVPEFEAEFDAVPEREPEKLAQVDVAPQMQTSTFTAGEPALDLEQLSLPFEADPAPRAGTETAAHDLALYGREIDRLDDPVGIAALRLEAGRLAELTGDLAAAREHYKTAAEADPRAVLAAAALRRTAYAAGHDDEALAALETEIGLASAAERRALAGWRIDLLMGSGETELAREAVAQLLEDTPEDARGLVAGMELAFAAGNAEELANRLDGLAAVVGSGPFAETLQTVNGRVAHAAGDDDAAVAAYQSVLRSSPGSRPATWGLERVALKAGRLGDASAAAGRILQTGLGELDPALAGAIALRRARVARHAGDSDGWIEGLRAAAALSPEDQTVARDLAEAYERRGDAAEAVRAHLDSATLSTSSTDQAHAYRRAARLLSAGVGTPRDTIEALRRLLVLDPDDAEAQIALEEALAEAGDLDSLVELDRAAANADDQGGVFERMRIAKRLFAGGHHLEAVRELEAARAAAPESPVIADTLVRTLAVAGMTEQRSVLLGELAATSADHRDPELAAILAAQAAEDFAYELMSADTALAAAGPAAAVRAAEAWQNVLEFDPESRSAHSALVRLAHQRDEPSDVLRALAGAQVAARHPARLTGLALRRHAMLLSGGLPSADVAEEVVREARSRAPDDPRSALAIMMRAASSGRWVDAATVMEEQAAAASSAAYAHSLRFRAAGLLHEHTEEESRVVALLAPVVAAYPDFAPAASLLERSHRRLGDASSLSEDFERRLSRSSGAGSDRFGILVREAEVFEFQVGDATKAAHLYGKALDERPADPLARDGFTRAAEAAGESGSLSQLALDDLKHADESNDPSAKADAYEELARIDLELRGDAGSARFSYESAAKIDRRRMPVLRALELSYLREQRDADVARIYGWQIEAINYPADAIHVSLERARTLVRAKRGAAEVLEEYKRAFELDQRCGLALQQLEASERRKGASAGLAAFEEAAARYFDADERAKAAFLTRAGETRHALEDLEGGIDCFKAAIETLPGYLPALIGWRRAALTGQLWLDAGESAERQAEHEIDDAHRASLEHLAGVVYMDRAMTSERAVPALQRVLTLAPEHVDAYLRLRMLFEENASHDQLAQLLGRRLEVENSEAHRIEIHHALAAIHRDYLEHPDGAKRELRAVLGIDPDNAVAVRGIADIAWGQQQWLEAAESLIALAKLSQDKDERIEIFRRLGRMYSDHTPDATIALTSYQRVLALDPSDDEALDKVATLSIQTRDWKRALIACERLLRATDRSANSKIDVLHRVGDIYSQMNQTARAEKAYRSALDVDPTSAAALDALVRFYRLGGDLRSLRVHLDTVAGAMRKRLVRIPLDVTAYHVMTRVLTTREEAGAQGSLAAGLCAAELALALGSEDDHVARLAASAGVQAPNVAGLGSSGVDDVLFHRGVPNGLRQLLRSVDERLSKATSNDLKRYGVGRGDRMGRSGEPAAQIIGQVAAQLGVERLEIYVSNRMQHGLAAEIDGDDVKLILGSALAGADRPARLRFLAGRALKMAVSGMSVPARMEANEFGAMLVALLRSFRPEFSPGGVDMGAVATQQSRVKKVVPGSMLQELGPYAMECASVDFDHNRIWEGIVNTANRAGLICAGSIQAAMEGLMLLHELPDASAAANHPLVQELMRFAVSEEHVIVHRMLRRAQAGAGAK